MVWIQKMLTEDFNQPSGDDILKLSRCRMFKDLFFEQFSWNKPPHLIRGRPKLRHPKETIFDPPPLPLHVIIMSSFGILSPNHVIFSHKKKRLQSFFSMFFYIHIC